MKMIKRLKAAIAKIELEPASRQRMAAQVLEHIIAGTDEITNLSEEGAKGLDEGLRQAERGQFASQEDVDKMFSRYLFEGPRPVRRASRGF